MCLQSLIVARKSDTGPWPSTTPAFLTGKCNSTQSAVLDSILPSTFPGATNADLDTYAFNGTGTGSFDYTTSDNNYNINLVRKSFFIDKYFISLPFFVNQGTQTFKSFFDAA